MVWQRIVAPFVAHGSEELSNVWSFYCIVPRALVVLLLFSITVEVQHDYRSSPQRTVSLISRGSHTSPLTDTSTLTRGHMWIIIAPVAPSVPAFPLIRSPNSALAPLPPAVTHKRVFTHRWSQKPDFSHTVSQAHNPPDQAR